MINKYKEINGGQLHLTECDWLRAFGTSPKFPFGELQIHSKR
jgi:hypothetical protein